VRSIVQNAAGRITPKPARISANIDGRVRVHDLRHSAVAIAIGAGAHPKQVQAMLGHSSIRLSMDTYGHLFDSLAEPLGERIDAVGRAACLPPASRLRAVGEPDETSAWAVYQEGYSGDGAIRTREGAQHPLTA
jgi:hypothetical protein